LPVSQNQLKEMGPLRDQPPKIEAIFRGEPLKMSGSVNQSPDEQPIQAPQIYKK